MPDLVLHTSLGRANIFTRISLNVAHHLPPLQQPFLLRQDAPAHARQHQRHAHWKFARTDLHCSPAHRLHCCCHVCHAQDGWTPLHWCASNGDAKCMALLLAHKAKTDVADKVWGSG